MPFGLKNTGATYQHAMVALFHDLMQKEVEVYVDDITAKSKQNENPIDVLRKLFERLRKFQLKLNLNSIIRILRPLVEKLKFQCCFLKLKDAKSQLPPTR